MKKRKALLFVFFIALIMSSAAIPRYDINSSAIVTDKFVISDQVDEKVSETSFSDKTLNNDQLFNNPDLVPSITHEQINRNRPAENLYRDVIILDFEGLGNSEPILDFYNGGYSGGGYGPGPDYGVTFSGTTLSLIASYAGGTGNFQNEPSPVTTMFFLDTDNAIMSVESGFQDGFSFYYSSITQAGSVEVYDQPEGNGNLLASLNLEPLGSLDIPGGAYNIWEPIGVTFEGTAKSVKFIGTANQIGFDDITFGSDTPGVPDLIGHVRDASTLAPIAGAVVTVEGISAITDEDGHYSIFGLPEGHLRAEFTGSPLHGPAPLEVSFNDLSALDVYLLKVAAQGYSNYEVYHEIPVAERPVTINPLLSSDLQDGELRFVLTWGAEPRDLDSHLKTPVIEGQEYHIYYANKGSLTSPPYAQLDVDVVQGYGPETITIAELYQGTYRYYVHKFAGVGDIAGSNAQVAIYDDHGLIQTIQAPGTGNGRYWHVANIDGATGDISIINQIYEEAPAAFEEIVKHKKTPEKISGGSTKATEIISWSWSFGDGNTSSEQNPDHVFTMPGVYDVSLTVESTAGETHTSFKENYVIVSESEQVPVIDVNPEFLEELLEPGQISTRHLTINNTGGAVLSWNNSISVTSKKDSNIIFDITTYYDEFNSDNNVKNIAGAGAEFTEPNFSKKKYKYSSGDKETFNILVMEETANNYHYDTALDNLGLARTLVTSWGALEAELTNGTAWDIVIVNSYLNSPSTTILDDINQYLVNGGLLIYCDWRLSSYSSHDLLNNLGIVHLSNFTTPKNFASIDLQHPVFNNPNHVNDFYWTHNQYIIDGQIVETINGSTRLAAFEGYPNSGTIVLNSSGNSFYNAFQADNFNGDNNSSGKLDIVELIENQIIFLMQDAATTWLSVHPRSGTVAPGASQTIEVTFNTSGLTLGVYSADINISSNDPVTPHVTVPVTLTVSDFILPPPTNLSATLNNTTGEVLLNWNFGTGTGFFDDFTDGYANNWVPRTGVWHVAENTYNGSSTSEHGWTSSYYNQDFSNFVYEAKIRKTHGSTSSNNSILFNGNPAEVNHTGAWNNLIGLGYNANGSWLAWVRISADVFYFLQGWTSSSYINTGLGEWNVLKAVVADGYMDLYINDVLHGTFYDDTFLSGKVGLNMYDIENNGTLEVDYVSLTPLDKSYAFGKVDYNPLRNIYSGDGVSCISDIDDLVIVRTEQVPKPLHSDGYLYQPVNTKQSFQHFNIYRNGVLRDQTTETSYFDQLTTAGTYLYTVTANYAEGESTHEGPVQVVYEPGEPTISVYPSSFDFGEVPVSTNSAPQFYNLSWSNLSNDITVSSNSGHYKISLNESGPFTSSITVPIGSKNRIDRTREPKQLQLISHQHNKEHNINEVLHFYDSKSVVLRFVEVEINDDVKNISDIQERDKLILNLFENTEYTSTVLDVYENINGTTVVTAKLDEFDYAYAISTTTEQRSLVNIYIPELLKYYQVISDPASLDHYVFEMNSYERDFLPDSPPLIPEMITPEDIQEQIRINEEIDNPNTGPNDPANVDVMIVYTPAAQTWANNSGGGIQNVVAQSMANAQLVLNNSQTIMSVTLVHSALVNYTESGYSRADLRRFTASPDYNPWGNNWEGYPIPGYMDEVHDWRNTYGADLCALFTHIEDTGGIAWLLNSTDGSPNYGFSITRVQQAATGYTHIHEMGHNMGLHHHKQQNIQPGPGLFSYSAGWRWQAEGTWYNSVMAYSGGQYYDPPTPGAGITSTEVPYFSNPSVTHLGVATGHATNGDNARNVREIKHVIAAYRPSASQNQETIWVRFEPGTTGILNGVINNSSSEVSATVNVTGTGVEDVPIPLCVALDNCELTYITGGHAEWFGQTAVTHDGIDAAQSGSITHNQESWFETSVTGPGELSFYWKVSSENNFDYLNFYINGTRMNRISGNVDWHIQEYSLNEGTHILKWSYTKDGSVSHGQDCGWVDQLSYNVVGNDNIMVIRDATASTNGIVTIELEIINDDEFVGFNADIPMPAGFTYIPGSAQLHRGDDVHFFEFEILPGNVARMLSAAIPTTPFAGNDGVIFSFDLQTPGEAGAFSFCVEDAVIANQNGVNIMTGDICGVITLEGSSTVTFNITNYLGANILDAIITLGGIENPAGDYVFENIEQGTHQYTVEKDCYIIAEGSHVISEPHALIDVELENTLGDANNDGAVNVSDIVIITNYFLGQNPYPFCFINADINGDGVINVTDVVGATNIFMEGKVSPHEGLKPTKAHVFLYLESIYIESDGTLTAMQFELDGISPEGFSMTTTLSDHQIMYSIDKNKLLAILFSPSNAPIPKGKIRIIDFEPTENQLQWGEVIVSDLNAEQVNVETHTCDATDVTGIDGFENIQVYPNPARDVIWIEFINISEKPMIISLINIHGQLIQNQTINNTGQVKTSMELNELPAGTYILRFESTYSYITKKIILKL